MSRARTFADLATASEAGNLGQANIIINGDMSIAQRATSSSSSGLNSIDRYNNAWGQISATQTQESLTSGSPYEAGFNNFLRLTNTSTSSNTASYQQLTQRIEAQHIANSGWNFKSSSSFMTFSFWARSSLAGTYYIRINTADGTVYYRIKAFTLSADTWTKVSFTFEGNSNLTINDDNGIGFDVMVVPHYGTSYTGSNASTTTWFTLTNNEYFPNFAQNWSNTSGATFDITGFQLEVGEVATPFKHESFGDNLQRCQRYFYKYISNHIYGPLGANGMQINTNSTSGTMYQGQHPITMRTGPSMAVGGSWTAEVATGAGALFALTGSVRSSDLFWQSQEPIPSSGASDGAAAIVYGSGDDDAFLSGDAEL